MYTPPHFSEDDLPTLHDQIHRARLANLITMGTDGLDVSHVPVLIDLAEGTYGTIYGHLSRGNPQWRTADTTTEALITFTGPDAYITPSWYATKAETEKVVPTWNYQAIHARGTVDFFEDAPALLSLVTRLTEKHEGRRANPWAVSDAPADFIAAQLKGIIGFRVPVRVLEGKSKMSQNRPPQDQSGVIDGLKTEGEAAEAAAAAVMSEKS